MSVNSAREEGLYKALTMEGECLCTQIFCFIYSFIVIVLTSVLLFFFAINMYDRLVALLC